MGSKEFREAECPVCKKVRTIQRRNKYDNARLKVCAGCVPKAYRMTIQSSKGKGRS